MNNKLSRLLLICLLTVSFLFSSSMIIAATTCIDEFNADWDYCESNECGFLDAIFHPGQCDAWQAGCKAGALNSYDRCLQNSGNS